MSVAPAILLVESFGDNLQAFLGEPPKDPVAARVVVVAGHVALDDLAADGRQPPSR
jgi:hypothetical protein